MTIDRRSAGIVLLGAFAALLSACSPAPQVLGDDECFKAVDALWTAVTARSPELVAQCTENLNRLHAAGQLSREGLDALNAVGELTRQGDWERAARDLRSLIRNQQRKKSGSN